MTVVEGRDVAGDPGSGSRALAEEERYVATLYARLDALRVETGAQLRGVLRSRAGGSPQARSERDAFAAMFTERLARLSAVEENLCFGRLDLDDGGRHHLGRIGLSGEDQRILLVDWRAPAAEPFYRATAAAPMGVRRRRHLRTRGRAVVSLDDEVFDVSALTEVERGELTGEAALLAALAEARTGRMRDVVATLQAEQDRIVRSDAGGVLVVAGGPGTGKTAVALHRVAYLLYTHRQRLATSGVLMVGPSAAFLRYVEQVLPSLGETSVVLRTVAELVPEVSVTRSEPEEVAALKGDARMAEVAAAAVADRQQVPGRDLEFRFEGRWLELPRGVCEDARRRARGSRRPHNAARNIFVRAVLTHLARQTADPDEWDGMDHRDRDGVLRDLIRTPEIRACVQELWPHLTPQALIGDLFADPGRLARAAGSFTAADRRLLARADGPGWTAADIPLLDEAAELIGEVDPWARLAAQRRAARAGAEEGYAGEVLGGVAGAAAGFVDAASLAARYGGGPARVTAAEHAASDARWAYGHVVVDEAQDLSPMAWRCLFRRCPSRSMTIVGDLAQGGRLWSPRSWKDVLAEAGPGPWRVEELTVGYRTPAEVMALAADVLAALDPALVAPRAIRSVGVPPRAMIVDPAGVGAGDVAAAVQAERAALGTSGALAVIVPDAARAAELGAGLAAAGPDSGPAADVTVMSVRECKGLEFDAVVLVDPAAVLAASPRGYHDLYVALTRTTNRLLVISPGPVPSLLSRLVPTEIVPA
jgi:DNA helicase IV